MTQLAMFGTDTLAEARARLFEPERFAEGSACPCCGQLVRLYRRKLNSGMAALLVWLNRVAPDGGYVDVQARAPRRVIRAKDYCLLIHWGLIEPAPNLGGGRQGTGCWRITAAGRAFASGVTTVPSHALVFNGECRGLDGQRISIRQALGSHFDFDELIRGNVA